MKRFPESGTSAFRPGDLQPPVSCPFCHSQDTRREAEFGTAHAYAQYYCRACRTPFEWIKWEDRAPAEDLPAFLKL